MKQVLEQRLEKAVKELFNVDLRVELTRPDERFGDYSTNVALQLAKPTGQNPRSVAETLSERLKVDAADQVDEVSIAGPGFINITLSDGALVRSLNQGPNRSLEGKTVVAEYSDPNPFKVLHAGHLYTSVVGDAIGNLLEQAGAEVHRVNFGGDVGLHVAKTMWAIIKKLGGEKPETFGSLPADLIKRAAWLSSRYVEGNYAYENQESARLEIAQINKRVYELHAHDDHQSPFAQIYWTCRQWSYDYFDAFYESIAIKPFEKYYPESSTAREGEAKVRDLQKQGVMEESDGAVVFKGEDHGLHTRVFLTREGLPTYETKDLGLIVTKNKDYSFDRSVIITANDIVDYMKVVLKVVEQFAPDLALSTTHLTHGLVKLQGGAKMSSRQGNILQAETILVSAQEANQKLTGQDNMETVLGAVKYAFLKQRLGGDIIYDPQESVSLEGNSGPYLQYAHARARSILRKAGDKGSLTGEAVELQKDERSLIRKISEYNEVIDRATSELMPHHICTYLYELAQSFNRFYEHNRVIGDERQQVRLGLVDRYATTLKNGLKLLGIAAPDKM